MKKHEQPKAGTRCWVCDDKNAWHSGQIDQPSKEATGGWWVKLDSPINEGKCHWFHRLQIRLTPPKKKVRDLEVGDTAHIVGKVINKSAGRITFRSIFGDTTFCEDGTREGCPPVVLRRIKEKANA